MALPVLTEKRGRGFPEVSVAKGNRSFEQNQLNDGDLAVGTILGEISASPGEFLQVAPLAGDGTEVAAAVLFDNVDASGGAERATMYLRDCELMEDELVFPAGVTAPQKATIIAELLAIGIVLRT